MENIRLLKKKLKLLTQEELIVLLQSEEKNVIIRILISRLICRFKNMNHSLQYGERFIKNMISNVNQIIYLRKEHSDWNENPDEDIIVSESIITFDSLPNVLLSHILSYLSFSGLLLFEQLNINTFLASRFQNSTLQHLDAECFMKCLDFSHKNNGCMYNWYRFGALKSLSVNCRDVVKYYYDFQLLERRDFGVFFKLPVWKSIEKLQILHPDGDKLFKREFLSAVERVEGNLKNVQYFDILSLNHQISSFASFTFLERLKGVGISFVAYGQKEIFCKISTKDLSCFHGSLYGLKELYNQKKTRILKELCLCQEAGDGSFLQWQELKNLERLAICAYQMQYIEEFKSIILLPDMQYVFISRCYASQWQCIINKLFEALRNCEKRKLMIKIEIYGFMSSDDVYLKDINELINIMNQNIRDFVLSIKMNNNSLLKKIVHYISSDNNNDYHLNEIGCCIDIVSNKSKIYGGSIMTDWSMKCFFCGDNMLNGCFPLSFYS